jgi:quercetin dioxygenase-like cupin family protein
MRSRLIVAALVIAGGIALFAGTLLATPPDKVTPTVYGVGKFEGFGTKGKVGAWKAAMNVTGVSDLHVLSNKIAPGGSFGWHSHPGPSFVIVKSGTATVYLGADPKCRPHRIRAGRGFVDRGLQTHLVQNEGARDLVTVVVSFTPRGAVRRIDEARPSQCPV